MSRKTQDWRCWYSRFVLLSSVLIASIQDSAFAQITPDGTLPNNSSVARDGNTFNITGGTTAGSNLFHSFEEFSVPNNGTASFNNAVDIQNIISRVTGSSVSDINGLIKANGTANLFLINPNGIVFGENAQLDIGGSFVGSTADAIGFGENNFFSASSPQNSSSLLQVSPNALFFNQVKAASIESNSVADSGRNLSDTATTRGLRVPDGKSLLLVGGDINIDGGGLYAFGGRVELGGLAGTGTVGLDGDGNNISLSFPDAVDRSNVFLSNGAEVNVNADNGGSIAVTAQNLEMTEGSLVFAGIGNGLGNDDSRSGNIDVNVTNAINLDNKSQINNLVLRRAKGQGGNININTSKLQLKDGAVVSTSTYSKDKGGNLTVNADDVQLIGRSEDGWVASGLFTSARSNSTGNAGDLTVKTNRLLVQDGAQVSAGTFGSGSGGILTVNADNVQLIDSGSGLFVSAEGNTIGNAGDLTIKTNNLLIQDGAVLGVTTSGKGNGGNLTVDAQEVQLIGTSKNGQSGSGLFASAQPNSTGDAGDLTVKTNRLLVQDGARLTTSTFGEGKGGKLTVNADNVQLVGRSEDGKLGSGLFASAQPIFTGNGGDGGDLTIKTNTLLVQDGAVVFTGTFGGGKGGNLSVDAQEVQLIGRSEDGKLGSGLFASAEQNSTGDAGELTVKTNTLIVKDGARLSASTFGSGSGGNLTVDAWDVQLIGESEDGRFGSDLFTEAKRDSTGDAGDLEIKTSKLIVQDGAQIGAGTFGEGNGGNLTIDAQEVQLIGRSKNGPFASGLFTSAERDSTGDAGDLEIKTSKLIVQDGAQVGASTFSSGDGGNLTVDASDVQLISAGGLFAQANRNSTGDAGDLTIKTNTLRLQDIGQVNTLTFGSGDGGNLTVDASDVQLIGAFSGLFTSVGPDSTGNAGDLKIKTSRLRVQDGAQMSAGTFGAGNGGNLTVDASDVQLIGTSKDGLPSGLFTQADPTSKGDAGDLTIKTTSTLLLQDGAQVGASTSGTGDGGNLTVNAKDVQLIGTNKNGQGASGLFASANLDSKGNAGNLTINTEILQLEDEVTISVAGLNREGIAGKLIINADSIRLNNDATLTASTLSNKIDPEREQATININSQDLIMRLGSNIFTNAEGENVAGGNINIETDFLIANENSDISANSVNFQGGNVRIDALDIFGTEFRDEPTPQSDITATGVSSDLSGTVELNTPEVDPNSGLVELPTIPVDTEVAQGCYSPGYAQSSFVIAGDGGLPPNPKDILTPDTAQIDWVSIKPSNNRSLPPVTTKPTSTPKPIVEATGATLNAKGQIVLAANPSTVTSNNISKNHSISCQNKLKKEN